MAEIIKKNKLNINTTVFLVLTLTILSNNLEALPKESMCKNTNLPDYAVIGDCYWYGIHFKKDPLKAKQYYLHAAGHGSEYAKLRAAATLLFESESPLENSMGLYILNDFSARDDVKIVHRPEYPGDINRRGVARYYLGIYWAQSNKYDLAKNHLIKALEDNFYPAAYALAYLNYADSLSDAGASVKGKTFIKKGNELQEYFFSWTEQKGYSCWLQSQIGSDKKGVRFPVNRDLTKKLLEQYGPCE